MESISLKPRQAQIRAMVIVLGILCACSLSVPLLVLPAALFMPLFTCPLVRHKEEWLCWVSAVVPFASAAVLHGFDPLAFSGLLLLTLLPMLITRFVPAKERWGLRGMALYIGAEALALTLFLSVFMQQLDAPLPSVVARMICDRIAQSKAPGLILYRLATFGLLTPPDNLPSSSALIHLLEPVYVQQMLMSFRNTLEQLCPVVLVTVFVHSCLVIGVFTPLRTEKLNHVMLVVQTDPQKPSERKTSVAAPPGFRTFTLPFSLRLLLIVCAFVSVLLADDSGYQRILSVLLYNAATAAFQLQGAAVCVFMFGRRHPDRLTLIGVLTGVIYVLAAEALLVMGLMDGFLHFRTNQIRHADES